METIEQKITRGPKVITKVAGIAIICLASQSFAQEGGRTPAPRPAEISVGLAPLDGETLAKNEPAVSDEAMDAFVRSLNGAKLVGRFTILGKDQKELPTEEYTISKCERLPQPGMVRMTARIKYGEVDVELPLDLPVKWAGDTPVISLTDLWLPGLGTFSSRVLFYKDSYAGTWQHGEVGGHLFGVVVRNPLDSPAGVDTPQDNASNVNGAKTVPAKPVEVSSGGSN